MHIVFYNRVNSIIDSDKDLIMLWSAVLFAKKIYYNGYYSYMIDYDRMFNLVSEEDKVISAQSSYKRVFDTEENRNRKDIILDIVEKNYENIKVLRKKKKRTKFELLLLIRLEKELQKNFKLSRDYYMLLREENQISDLPQFTGVDEKHLITVHYLTEYYDLSEFAGNTINPLTDSFMNKWFHFFDESVESVLESGNDGVKYFTAYKFLEVPAVMDLKEVQIRMYRNSVDSLLVLIDERLRTAQELLNEYEYAEVNLKAIAEIMHKYILFDIESMQDDLLNGLYENTNEDSRDKRYTLYLCVSSYQNVIDLYKHSEIFTDELMLSYVKENVGKEIDLNKARMFLYLKTE